MIIISAPMRITRGEPYSWTATVVGQDWTGYTGTVTFRRNSTLPRTIDASGLVGEETDTILTATVTGDAAGVISFSLTAADTLLFPALDRMGWFAQAKAEINMTDGSDVQKFQLRVSTAESFG
jgi:hypothetical protein